MANSSQTSLSITEQTVADFMDATGEEVFNMELNLRQYTSLKMLRLYAKWANAVRNQRRRLDRDEVHTFDDGDIEKVICSLTPTCARLEVSAISELSSLERSSNNQSRIACGNNFDDDDDGTSTELANLENTIRELRVELESQEETKLHRRNGQSVGVVSKQVGNKSICER